MFKWLESIDYSWLFMIVHDYSSYTPPISSIYRWFPLKSSWKEVEPRKMTERVSFCLLGETSEELWHVGFGYTKKQTWIPVWLQCHSSHGIPNDCSKVCQQRPVLATIREGFGLSLQGGKSAESLRPTGWFAKSWGLPLVIIHWNRLFPRQEPSSYIQLLGILPVSNLPRGLRDWVLSHRLQQGWWAQRLFHAMRQGGHCLSLWQEHHQLPRSQRCDLTPGCRSGFVWK